MPFSSRELKAQQTLPTYTLTCYELTNHTLTCYELTNHTLTCYELTDHTLAYIQDKNTNRHVV